MGQEKIIWQQFHVILGKHQCFRNFHLVFHDSISSFTSWQQINTYFKLKVITRCYKKGIPFDFIELPLDSAKRSIFLSSKPYPISPPTPKNQISSPKISITSSILNMSLLINQVFVPFNVSIPLMLSQQNDILINSLKKFPFFTGKNQITPIYTCKICFRYMLYLSCYPRLCHNKIINRFFQGKIIAMVHRTSTKLYYYMVSSRRSVLQAL